MFLKGHCNICSTFYSADHETYMAAGQNEKKKLILNHARYLKIGTHLWVDRVFSNAVCNGMYHFHASANAYMQYLNSAFGMSSYAFEFGRKQIWQAFIQESIRAIASASDRVVEAKHNISIEQVCNCSK